jgi:glycosyltransferase involved in cell wall biosynthesis
MRVSVVLTVYNAAWCIERAVESILGQTFAATEVLVCDDGSTDGTADLVERRFGPPVRVLRLPHRNASATRAIGIQEATGDWLAFLDADDIWHPEKLERQIAYLERHPEVRWLGTDGRYIDSERVLLGSWFGEYFDHVRDMRGDLLETLVERCYPLMSAMIVERRAYDAVGGLDPEIIHSHDYDLWLRLATRFPGAMLAEPLIDYWTGPGTLSRQFEGRHIDDLFLMRRIAQGGLPAPPAIRRRAAVRAAALDFDLAILCLRTGRIAEGRQRLLRAGSHGPWARRVTALAGSVLPLWVIGRLMSSSWVKSIVAGTRLRSARLEPVGAPEPIP